MATLDDIYQAGLQIQDGIKTGQIRLDDLTAKGRLAYGLATREFTTDELTDKAWRALDVPQPVSGQIGSMVTGGMKKVFQSFAHGLAEQPMGRQIESALGITDETLRNLPANAAATVRQEAEKLGRGVTEGIPAAGRAAWQEFSAPSEVVAAWRRKLQGEPVLGVQGRQAPTWRERREALSPVGIGKLVWDALGRVQSAIGAGAAELGPEQAKPLTNALAQGALQVLTERGLSGPPRPEYEIPRPEQAALPPRQIITPPPGAAEPPYSGVASREIQGPPEGPPRQGVRPYAPAPPVLPGRRRLPGEEMLVHPEVPEPPRPVPSAEAVAAERAGIDTTTPEERPLHILDAQGRVIHTVRRGWKPSKGVEPPRTFTASPLRPAGAYTPPVDRLALPPRQWPVPPPEEPEPPPYSGVASREPLGPPVPPKSPVPPVSPKAPSTQEPVAAPGGKGKPPATFLGWQEAPKGRPPVALWNLTEAIGGKPVQDTVSSEWLRRQGYDVQEPAQAPGAQATSAQPLGPPTPPKFERTAIGDQGLVRGAAPPPTPPAIEPAVAADLPPESLREVVNPKEWEGMDPKQRSGFLGLMGELGDVAKQIGDAIADESGHLNLEAMVGGWRRLRHKFPMDSAVRAAYPDSPVVTEIERHGAGQADALTLLWRQPWMRGAQTGRLFGRSGGIRQANPDLLNEMEQAMVDDWRNAGGQLAAQRAVSAAEKAARTTNAERRAKFLADRAHWSQVSARARDAAIARHASPELQAAMRERARRLVLENQSRAYFSLPPIPEEMGPYIPREVDPEFREAVSIGGGGGAGSGRAIQSTVGGSQHKRTFETQLEGEPGHRYIDRRNAIVLREWDGIKLRSTHRLFRNLERAGVLFRDEAAARAASRTGHPWRLEQAPGGEWWVRSEEEARLLEQNLTERPGGPMLSFVHYANALLRNPQLFNPLPHVTKNMGVKYLLAAGVRKLPRLAMDFVEYARDSRGLRARFRQAMPYSESGETASTVLNDLLVRGSFDEAVQRAHEALSAVTLPSRRLIFKLADPAMRYSLWKGYVEHGLTDLEAANHAWEDLIRYGVRSDITDRWRALPLNFFVPWRFGTVAALVKQIRNHPLRTALFVGGVDYLRDQRYRATGRWTHLPWDYVEAPIAQAIQEHDWKTIAAIAATTYVLGPGGGFAAAQLSDAFKDIAGRGDWNRVVNLFWGFSQLYDLHHDWDKWKQTGDPQNFVNMLTAIAFQEHATTYEPRRIVGPALTRLFGGVARGPEATLNRATMIDQKGRALVKEADALAAAGQIGEAMTRLDAFNRAWGTAYHLSPSAIMRARRKAMTVGHPDLEAEERLRRLSPPGRAIAR